MNRLRIRIEGKVREFVLAQEEQQCLECVALAVQRRVRIMDSTRLFSLTYIGARAWDVYIEDRKVGHAKVFHHADNPASKSGPTLWGWFLLIVSCYLALC